MFKTLTIIDDDPVYQLIAGKLINKTEIFSHPTFFNSGIDAIEEFKKEENPLPHIILLDINMPYMDGWQFIKKLKQLRPNCKEETNIYIVSSSISERDKHKAEEIEEVIDFISKPLHVERLKAIGKNTNQKINF
ncbi:response regulator [Christiangramia sp.]|uniref:response regulator n=1 Tax=Christiangramia sp. TaxID=1931228 RepID=UPI0026087355|nr:response regulator [Christiangramia sp.]